MTYQLGFDIGGTFTDLALLDTEAGRLEVFKVLTTPTDPAKGALDGIEQFLTHLGLKLTDLTYIVHATTLVANTLIEHKGALVGLITTQGFRDILEIRTEQRYDIYDLFLRYPPLLSPRYLRHGIRERMDRDGRVLQAPNSDEIKEVVKKFKMEGVEAIAVCFLHAFRNSSHEEQVQRLIQAEWPNVPISISSTVAPEIREYERVSTTTANAYVQPLLTRYLKTLQTELEKDGFGGAFYPMLSSGSVSPLSVAIEQPIRLVESGPAAGAIAASYFGNGNGRGGPKMAVETNLGVKNQLETRTGSALSFDMGGTTAKLCLIDQGRPTIAPNLEVARVHRFKKGSGYPLQFPTVEMLEIGAGGGSIAWFDSLGLMKVGPESASSNPGPACYGFGGQQATVTDADLVLGYLNPDYFLGGEMRLDVDAAHTAIAKLAESLQISVIETAAGIHRLVNETMAAAAKIHVIEKARDPRAYPLICFGGAGPVHAAGVAQILGCPEVIAPFRAGVASAMGLLVAPVAFDFVRSYPVSLNDISWSTMQTIIDDIVQQGLNLLREANISPTEASVERQVDGRFAGQLHEITLSLPNDLTALKKNAFEEYFQTQYQQLYRHLPSQMGIELLTWRVRVSGPQPQIPFRPEQVNNASTDVQVALKGSRPAYFAEQGDFVETQIYDRYQLLPGMTLEGPAIIEERESTLIIRPNMSSTIDHQFNLHIHLSND